MRRWWAGETVDHCSEQLTFTQLPAAARPVQEPLEVWLGGRGPKALERAGRIADGWLGAQLTPPNPGPPGSASTRRPRLPAANSIPSTSG